MELAIRTLKENGPKTDLTLRTGSTALTWVLGAFGRFLLVAPSELLPPYLIRLGVIPRGSLGCHFHTHGKKASTADCQVDGARELIRHLVPELGVCVVCLKQGNIYIPRQQQLFRFDLPKSHNPTSQKPITCKFAGVVLGVGLQVLEWSGGAMESKVAAAGI
jgi:hypothetical protein